MSQIDFSFIPIFFAVFLFSLSFHEAAHAWTADKFGDPTGRYMGRVSLNPIPHIDIFGTIIFPLVCMLTPGAMMFGWAKPVPVNTMNMRDPKKGDIWVSLAGTIKQRDSGCCFLPFGKVSVCQAAGRPRGARQSGNSDQQAHSDRSHAECCPHDLQPDSDPSARRKPRAPQRPFWRCR